jgi:hypothetical protein
MKRPYWICAIYFVLLVIGIPWYWPEESTSFVLGLPLWVVIAIAVSICASMFTAFLLLRYPWDTDVTQDE